MITWRFNRILEQQVGLSHLNISKSRFRPTFIQTNQLQTIQVGGTMARAAETDPHVGGRRIRLTDVSQDGENDAGCSSLVHPSSKPTNSRHLTTTIPNQGQNGNYVELDSTRRDRSAPSVYKRLKNKKQQLVQSSPVTHTPEVEDEPHYCNVNRPRLPTPESNNSVESNMDQLTA